MRSGGEQLCREIKPMMLGRAKDVCLQRVMLPDRIFLRQAMTSAILTTALVKAPVQLAIVALILRSISNVDKGRKRYPLSAARGELDTPAPRWLPVPLRLAWPLTVISSQADDRPSEDDRLYVVDGPPSYWMPKGTRQISDRTTVGKTCAGGLLAQTLNGIHQIAALLDCPLNGVMKRRYSWQINWITTLVAGNKVCSPTGLQGQTIPRAGPKQQQTELKSPRIVDIAPPAK